jgi:hypothetical protein
MPKYEKGQTIHARGRDWIVEIAPELEGVDILIASPLARDDELKRMRVAEEAWKRRGNYVLFEIPAQRGVICLEEIAA